MQIEALIWIVFIVKCFQVNSQSVELQIDNTDRTMEFIYPHHGDTLMLSCVDGNDLCVAEIVIAGYFKDCLTVNAPRNYALQFTLYDQVNTIKADDAIDPLLSFKVTVVVRKSDVVAPISFQFEDVTSGTILYQSDQMKLLLVHPSDYGLAMLVPPSSESSNSMIVDFIELGTSNFDTATQAAALLLASGLVSSMNGVAVEAVVQYLAALPMFEGGRRINAGITTLEHEEMLTVFYLPESVIDKVALGHYNKGCTSVGSVDNHILTQVCLGRVPPEAVMKAYIPALTIDRLLRESVLPGQRLRLLKTDMEGMDQPVLHQMLDHYQSRTGSSTITAEYPCVVFFETKTNGLEMKDMTLFDKFTKAGYFFYGLLDDTGKLSEADAMAINCMCDRDDFTISLALLSPTVYDVDSVVEVCS